jgi:hypothetical protein
VAGGFPASLAAFLASADPVRGNGCTGTAAHEKDTYQPSASLETVTVLLVPSTGRDQRTAMRPIVFNTREPCSSCAHPCALTGG